MAVIAALVLTFCICQTQCWGVEAAGLSGPRGQTNGPAPARARPALGLGQGHIGVRRLVEDLEVQKGALITTQCIPYLYRLVFKLFLIIVFSLSSIELDEMRKYTVSLKNVVNHHRFSKTFYMEVAMSLYLWLC